MTGVKGRTAVALIGDVVGSRTAADRRLLHERIGAAIAEVNAALGPVQPLRITVGDEYQGVFGSLGDAVRATLRLRLALLPAYDVRHGLGRGEVTVLQEEPRVEDGPGWWAARGAIEEVKALAAQAGTRQLRTSYAVAEGVADDTPAVRAALMCRDHLVGSLSERSLLVLRGLLAGRSQKELAADAGISASAVSQRVRSDGLAVLVAADEAIGDLP